MTNNRIIFQGGNGVVSSLRLNKILTIRITAKNRIVIIKVPKYKKLVRNPKSNLLWSKKTSIIKKSRNVISREPRN